MKGYFHTEGLSRDLSEFDPKLLCSRTMPRPARKGGLGHSAQEVWKQQCPNKEAGCYIPISSSVLCGRCWSRKMGKMIVVGDSKKKTSRPSAETLQTTVNKSRLADEVVSSSHVYWQFRPYCIPPPTLPDCAHMRVCLRTEWHY